MLPLGRSMHTTFGVADCRTESIFGLGLYFIQKRLAFVPAKQHFRKIRALIKGVSISTHGFYTPLFNNEHVLLAHPSPEPGRDRDFNKV